MTQPGGREFRTPATPDDVAERLAKASAEARKNLDISLVNFPEQLKNLPHWIVWRFEAVQNKKGEWRITKVPYIAQLDKPRQADSTNPKTWCSFNLALAILQAYWKRKNGGFYDGIGFVFTNSGYSAIDLDHVLKNGAGLLPWARKLITEDLDSSSSPLLGTFEELTGLVINSPMRMA